MSSYPANPTGTGAMPSARAQPRSWVTQVLYRVFRRTGAIIGLGWIVLVALFAVFAPFIASSFPLLMKTKSGWSSPLIAHLYPSDVALLITAGATLAMLATRRWRGGLRLAVVVWAAAAAIPLASWRVWERSWPGWVSDFGLGITVGVAAAVIVMLAAVLVVLPLKVRATIRQRLLVVVPMLILAVLLVIWPVSPPRVVVYSAYRQAQASGQILYAIHAPIPYSPTDRMGDIGDTRMLSPSRAHLMGTTEYGEDLASRMIHACRIAMSIGFISTSIALVIGIGIGAMMGYFSGVVDLIGMRLVEVFNAIPTIFLLIAFVAFYGRNLYLIMVIIGLTSWVGYALFVRAEFLRLREQEFVLAARACGVPLWSILYKHMLPNGVAPVLVTASFGVASAILSEATLSFLGLGLVDQPSWGQMLDEARGVGGSFYWWIALYPGLAIFLTVFAYNLVGEALRDAIDPHSQKD